MKRNVALERQMALAREVLREESDVLQELTKVTVPEFLEADVVVFLHDNLLREYGGAHGAPKDDLL